MGAHNISGCLKALAHLQQVGVVQPRPSFFTHTHIFENYFLKIKA